MQAGVSETGNCNVWVGGLPNGIDSDTFNGMFAEYGTVVTSRVFPEKWYGFVTFSTPEEAGLVVSQLNGVEYAGRSLQVRYHTPKGSSKGNGLGAAGAWSGAGAMGASSFGSVASWAPQKASIFGKGAHIASSWANAGYSKPPAPIGASRLAPYGSGKSSPKGSISAATNGMLLGGLAVADPSVGGAFSASQEGLLIGRAADFNNGNSSSNLYITGIPGDADELYLYKVFAPFGCILTTFVKDTAQGRIGFVTYSRPDEAAYAIERLNGAALTHGDTLQVRLQTKKR